MKMIIVLVLSTMAFTWWRGRKQIERPVKMSRAWRAGLIRRGEL